MALTLDGDNGISGINGSAATPAVQGTDTNTGLTFGTDEVNIVTGGTTRATVDSSGAVTIASGDLSVQSVTVGRGAGAISSNTCLGNQALDANTSGTNNVALGYRALSGNTTGSSNVSIGDISMYVSTTAANNVAVGSGALYAITTGSTNVAIGKAALDAMTIGGDAVAVGRNAFGKFNRTGDTSTPGVAIGSGAGDDVTTAYNNTIIGTNAATSFTTGVFGVYIGHSTTASAGGASDEMVIGTRGGTGKGNSTAFINPNGGAAYQGNNSSSWSTTSDRRLKKNIVDNTEGLDVINQVRVVNFEYRLPDEIEEADLQGQALVSRDENDEVTGLTGVKLGVIAQELQAVCSDCVKEESSGVLSVVDDSLFWHMINAVKELSAKNASLEARIAQLEGGAA